jgi:hypothetical protein
MRPSVFRGCSDETVDERSSALQDRTVEDHRMGGVAGAVRLEGRVQVDERGIGEHAAVAGVEVAFDGEVLGEDDVVSGELDVAPAMPDTFSPVTSSTPAVTSMVPVLSIATMVSGT